jgi:predicted AlkP superfamily pyrophosphatase or phosphodiesterase
MRIFFLFTLWTLITHAAQNPIIVVSIDGLRPDAIDNAQATTLLNLIEGGLSFDNAHTVRPSVTLPAHTSMFTGLDPEQHGITWDHYAESYGPVRFVTALELAKNEGLHTAAFVAKEKLLHLNRPNSVNHFELTDKNSEEIAIAFRNYVQQRGLPDLTFLHLPDPDTRGHLQLWMSPFYFQGVRDADDALRDIIATARATVGGQNPYIIITADHGGIAFNHLTNLEQNNRIPFIVHGPGIPAGVIKHDAIRVYDTAATILSLLKLPVPPNWRGRPAPLDPVATKASMPLSLGKPVSMAKCQENLDQIF